MPFGCVLVDALSTDANNPLENRDKEDIQIALKGMSFGIEKLLELARTARRESDNLGEKIATMKSNIHGKKNCNTRTVTPSRPCSL
jgi:hypothetical protein